MNRLKYPSSFAQSHIGPLPSLWADLFSGDTVGLSFPHQTFIYAFRTIVDFLTFKQNTHPSDTRRTMLSYSEPEQLKRGLRRLRKKLNYNRIEQAQRYAGGIQYSVDFITAILLFIGQITTTGIFAVPEGFYLALTGPVFGGVASEGINPRFNVALGFVDKIVAILLVLNIVRVTGPYITSGRFFLVVSGEIFGIKEIAGTAPLSQMKRLESDEVATVIKDIVLSHTGRKRQGGGST